MINKLYVCTDSDNEIFYNNYKYFIILKPGEIVFLVADTGFAIKCVYKNIVGFMFQDVINHSFKPIESK